MTEFRYFHAWLYSFFSKKLYVDVANRWRGNGFVYLLLLIMLFIIPQTIFTNNQLRQFVTSNQSALKEMPTITIKNGIVSTPENKAYLLKANPKSTLNFLVIDTTGQYKSLSQADAIFLLTRDQIMFKDVHGDSKAIHLQKSMNEVFNKDHALNMLSFIKKWGILLVYVPVFFVNFMQNFLFLIIYTLLSYFILSKVMHANLNYHQSSRLAAVAMSPSIIICNMLCTIYPEQPIFYTLLTIGYVIFGVYAARSSSKELTK
ncbi:MAG: DUF1189 family protein [Gammaproteobacteria bacterium]